MPEIWQDFSTGFSLALIAYAATNVDNFLALVGLNVGTAESRVVVRGFAIATAATLALAASFTLLSYVISPGSLGYLGVIPIVMGLRLLASAGTEPDSVVSRQVTAASVSGLLVANSMDTVATLGSLFAESEPVVRVSLVLGYVVTALIMIRAVLHVSRRADRLFGNGKLARYMAPLVMIGVGCYVLINTGTDLEL
jgi:cadmium resistance protein CadD (predicted permease)